MQTTDTPAILDLAAAIAEYLPGWKAERPRPEPEPVHWAHIVHPDGRCLSLTHEWRDPSKLVVTGDYPRDGETYKTPRDWGAIGYHDPSPRIGVSVARGAETIAKDITRRFLPEYSRIFAACLEKKAQGEAWRAKMAERAAALLELLPDADLRGTDDSPRIYFYSHNDAVSISGEAEPHDDSISFPRLNVPVALGLEIARLLGKAAAT